MSGGSQDGENVPGQSSDEDRVVTLAEFFHYAVQSEFANQSSFVVVDVADSAQNTQKIQSNDGLMFGVGESVY